MAPPGSMLAGMSDVSRILSAATAGDPRAAEELLPLVYEELRKLARAHSEWIDQMLSGLDFTQRERLYVALGTMKMTIARASQRRAK